MLFADEPGVRGRSGIDTRPLAEQLRPSSLADFVGQTHILGADKPLTLMADADTIHSMILWGPPGCGKTTLARLLAEATDCRFVSLSAVLAGIKEVREEVKAAEHYLQTGTRTVLFVDEVHRFNKSQQDAFLPHVERGTFTLIGATTENPSFEVNAALLSRARIYVLEALTEADLEAICRRGEAKLGRSVVPKARQLLARHADGDGRRVLNILETAVQLTEGEVTAAVIEQALGSAARRFDHHGDAFYEQISALHKAVRGSSPDAALYWLCRMLDGGADPLYLGRRLLRMASEDIGNAEPRAVAHCIAALQTYERLGSPEGELALAQATLYLSSVPKSDAVYQAFKAAQAAVTRGGSLPVPMHLRNAPTSLMKDLGYGSEYRHAHNETHAATDAQLPERYAAGEDYFPEEMQPVTFYQPVEAGLESKIRARLVRLRALDAQSSEQRRTPAGKAQFKRDAKTPAEKPK